MGTNNKFQCSFTRIERGHAGLGAYEIKILVPIGHVRLRGDGQKYLIAKCEGRSEQTLYIDELSVRPKVKLDIWIDINEQRANFIRNRKAIRAALLDTPILI